MTLRRQNLIQSGVARTLLGACLILSFLAFSVEPSGAQTIPSWNRACKKAFKQYQTRPRHKAFAISNATSANDRQSCGWADEMPSKAAAQAEAVRQCRLSGGSGCVIKASE